MLKYVGPGFYSGIPARDLSDFDLTELEKSEAFGLIIHKGDTLRSFLLRSGLYIEIKANAGGSTNKARLPEQENKRGEE